MADTVFSVMMAGIRPKAMSSVPSGGGWFNVVREGWAGAYQQAVEIDAPRSILAFSGVFAPLTLITCDIAKLRIKLVDEDPKTGICTEVKSGSPFLQVLRKPNRYQNRIKFMQQWMISKLIHGNAYILKQRDGRGLVVALYVLDPQRVTPLVTEMGDVYYRLATDNLTGLTGEITVAASEIIHDMMPALWHPLVGVSPLYAAGLSATQGRKIQNNSALFFENMSRPGGMLTAPENIDDETATRLKNEFEENFGGKKMGRLFVAGSGLSYQALGIPAEAAQLIDQLKWTVEDVARCFHMPAFKVGGAIPANHTTETLGLMYYTDCLQSLIEDAELCLKEGLSLPGTYDIEFDIAGLARMDTAAQAEMLIKASGGAYMKPNEARAKQNMGPVEGGDTLYKQHQDYSIAALAKRDAGDDPFGTAKPQPAPTPTPAPASDPEDDETRAFVDALVRKCAAETLTA